MARNAIIKRLLFALYLFAAVSVLLEIGVRLWGYSERHICDPIYATFAAARGSSDAPRARAAPAPSSFSSNVSRNCSSTHAGGFAPPASTTITSKRPRG